MLSVDLWCQGEDTAIGTDVYIKGTFDDEGGDASNPVQIRLTFDGARNIKVEGKDSEIVFSSVGTWELDNLIEGFRNAAKLLAMFRDHNKQLHQRRDDP